MNPEKYLSIDRELVKACQQNQSQAQYKLYAKYSGAMYNICLRMLSNPHDAEDALQNAFVDVFKKINSFRNESTIGAWIKRVVINNCLNMLNKRKMKFEELDDKFMNLSQVEDAGYEPEYSIERINSAVKKLPEGYRVVFNLYAFEGMDHKEISEMLDISESTSKTQYMRAKFKLKEIIKVHQN
jgi:RNA polymerase sigma-70 factor (ECF subfamily)